MKKKIKDVMFIEFDNWANKRACDGQWDSITAITCSKLISKILKETKKYLFKRRRIRKQEELFKQYKGLYLNLDYEIELP